MSKELVAKWRRKNAELRTEMCAVLAKNPLGNTLRPMMDAVFDYIDKQHMELESSLAGEAVADGVCVNCGEPTYGPIDALNHCMPASPAVSPTYEQVVKHIKYGDPLPESRPAVSEQREKDAAARHFAEQAKSHKARAQELAEKWPSDVKTRESYERVAAWSDLAVTALRQGVEIERLVKMWRKDAESMDGPCKQWARIAFLQCSAQLAAINKGEK